MIYKSDIVTESVIIKYVSMILDTQVYDNDLASPSVIWKWNKSILQLPFISDL